VTRERFKVIPAVYLIVLRGDEVLLQRRRGTGYFDGHYGLIAGHVDGSETAPAAMVREAREEAGLTLAEVSLRCVHVMHRNSEVGEWFDVFFTADRWAGEPRICEPDRCDELAWRRLDDLPPNMVPSVRAALEAWRRGESFSVYGWSEEG
jgi:8-oxo-dGTP pyrophosphatase MutT (NUDIX family)